MLSIVGIAPHPPIIIPEIGRGRLQEAQKTVDGMRELSRRVKEKQPKILIIVTPHGQVVRAGPAILASDRLSGDFGQFGFPNIKVELETDRELLDILVEASAGSPVKPVLLGKKDQHSPGGELLDHGAMVPLYYLQEAGVSVPGMHITISLDSYQDLYQFGRIIMKAIKKRGVPVAVIASGDLSHRLKPGAPAGFNPRGKEFDQKLVHFITEGKVEDILNMDQSLVEDAGECGLRPIMIALGMLEQTGFHPEVISYEGPFGVGYMVAALHPRDQSFQKSSSGEGGPDR